MARAKDKQKVTGTEKVLMGVGSLVITAVSKFPMTDLLRAWAWHPVWLDYSFEIWLGIIFIVNLVVIWKLGTLNREDAKEVIDTVKTQNELRDELKKEILAEQKLEAIEPPIPEEPIIVPPAVVEPVVPTPEPVPVPPAVEPTP